MKKRLLLSGFLTIAIAAVAVSQSSYRKAPYRNAMIRTICWVQLPTFSNFGYTSIVEEAKKKLEVSLQGKQLILPAITPVQEMANLLIENGCDLVISVERKVSDFLVKVSELLPHKNFLLYGVRANHRNIASWYDYSYQPLWVMGQLAGLLSKGGIIGFMSSGNERVLQANIFFLGARKINENIRGKVAWPEFNNYESEEKATENLYRHGVDVIFLYTDTLAPIQYLDTFTNNIQVMGINDRFVLWSKGRYVASIRFDLTAFFSKIIQDYLAGSMSYTDHILDFSNYLSIDHNTNMPTSIHRTLSTLITQLKHNQDLDEIDKTQLDSASLLDLDTHLKRQRLLDWIQVVYP